MNTSTLKLIMEDHTPSKGTLAGCFKWDKDSHRKPAYIALKAVDKVTRPFIHVADHISSGIDYAKDKIKGTKIGKNVMDTADEYYNDPEGKHKVTSSLLKGATSYAINRGVSHGLGVGKSTFWKVADAGVAGVHAGSQYSKSNKRSKMNAEQLKKVIDSDKSRESREKKQREERMKNFWKDMKF
jgi:hypothetical protein